MASVTILHHGRREKIAVDASKPLVSVEAAVPTTATSAIGAPSYLGRRLFQPSMQLAALDAYCSKVGLDANKYNLVAGKNKVDLSLPFRLANIPTNSVLELVPRTDGAATAADVKVALQFGSGGRLEGSFSAGTTLADLLLTFIRSGQVQADEQTLLESNFAGVTVVYMRSQISGGDVASTTLAGMGISRGSVSLRASLPAPPTAASAAAPGAPTSAAAAASASSEAPTPVSGVAASEGSDGMDVDLDGQQQVDGGGGTGSSSAALSSESPEELRAAVYNNTSNNANASPNGSMTPAAASGGVSVESSAAQGAAIASTSPAAASSTAAGSEGPAPSGAVAAATTGGSANPQHARIRATGAKVRAAIAQLRMSAFDADAAECLSTLIKMLDNLVARPGEGKIRCVRLGNPKYHAAVGRHPGGTDILRAVGFVDDNASAGASSSELSIILNDEDEDDEITLGVRALVALEATSLGVRLPPAPEPNTLTREAMAREVKRVLQAFDPFKASVMKMEVDERENRIKPDIKVLGGGGGDVEMDTGRGGGGGGSNAAGGAGAGSSFSMADGAGSTASASSAAAGGGALPPAGSPHMTAIERKVAGLKARAAEIIERSGPRERNTTIILYDAGRTFNPNTFSAAEASGGLQGGSGDGSASNAAGGGAGSAAAASSSDADRSDAVAEPGDSRLQLEYMRKKMRAEKEKEEGFRTKAMRELDQLQKAKVYTSTLIRVQTPDRTIMQGTFSPLEPVGAVHAWVRSLLQPQPDASLADGGASSTSLPFYLYQTPPQVILQESGDKSLADAKLQPAVLLYLGWGTGPGGRGWPLAADGQPQPPPAHPTSYLSPAALDLANQVTGVDAAAAAAAAAYPTSMPVVEQPKQAVDEDAAVAALLGGTSAKAGGGAGGAKPGASKGGKPGWLKL